MVLCLHSPPGSSEIPRNMLLHCDICLQFTFKSESLNNKRLFSRLSSSSVVPPFCLFFICIKAKLAQMWHDFHWGQDGCLCKALWNGWVASVWKEFCREVFYLTHHQRSSETNKLKYTITAEIKLKIKNWVIPKQRGFRSIYWPCVRKSQTVPTLLAPSGGKTFIRASIKIRPLTFAQHQSLNLKHPSTSSLLQSVLHSLSLSASLCLSLSHLCTEATLAWLLSWQR